MLTFILWCFFFKLGWIMMIFCVWLPDGFVLHMAESMQVFPLGGGIMATWRSDTPATRHTQCSTKPNYPGSLLPLNQILLQVTQSINCAPQFFPDVLYTSLNHPALQSWQSNYITVSQTFPKQTAYNSNAMARFCMPAFTLLEKRLLYPRFITFLQAVSV